MNLVSLALRRPISLLVMVLASALLGYLALDRMSRDIFPDLGVPVLYVAQPFGGMDPAQMEGLSPTLFGQVKTAKANERDAALEVERRFEQVRAQVVRLAQDSATNAKIIPIAKQQVTAAEEALRLAQRNLGVGTALTVDVLQAADALNDAQLRYASAATAYNQSQVNLLAALGLIDRVSLTPVEGSSSVPNIRPAASAR